MSETPAQPGPSTPQTADPKNGSLGAGIALAWACLIAGYFVVGALSSVVFSVLNGANSGFGAMLAILLFLLPWAAMIWLIVHFRKTNQPRTALGIGVGIASIIGVLLLLVAACFGLLSNTNFH
ncbi:MAG TPA: hypothetical protein VFE67_08735 [Rudaea sp.]|jgi:hypothetical protein|nr:hypothetical protein [Rudaea sp.]